MVDPSHFFSDLAGKAGSIKAPFEKLSDVFAPSVRAKLLLVLNHIVAQEPEAMERLKVYAGRSVMFEGPLAQEWLLLITPAGLFEEPLVSDVSGGAGGEDASRADLRLKMKAPGPADLKNMLLKGQHPPVEIVGDADLAAVFAWLTENLRWDYAQDLSKIIGDSPTQFAQEQLQGAFKLLRGFFDAVSQRVRRPGE